MSGFRLPAGGKIDRGRPLAFSFDGKPYLGVAGDSIASALLANGIRIVGRSFKYHRPRGVWGAWTEEPNAIVDVTRAGITTPNLRATVELLENDVAVRSVNAAPTAAEDRSALIDAAARFMPSGFYYKTFIWPRWETFEPIVRAMAGLGVVDPRNRPPAENPQFNAHCDCLIVGAGPAGLAAGAAAARAGEAVVLIDDHAEIGGQLTHRGGTIDGGDGRAWAESVSALVTANGGRVMTATTAFGVYDHNLVCAWERRAPLPDALWRIRPKRVVVAAGAIERPLIVPDNDRPAVMSADAALVYLRRFAVLVGRRIAVATNNDSAYPVAEALAEAGAEVGIFDTRADGPATQLSVLHGAEIEGVVGRSGVTGVKVGGGTRPADALILSGGWTPTVHLAMQARGKLRYDESLAALIPAAEIEGMTVAGAANGAFTLDAALRQGHAAGGGRGPAPNAPAGVYRIAPAWPAPDALGRRWIDFQSDVTLKDVILAGREGYVSVEHLKRYTTLGMATDQGKTSSVNGLAAMAALTGRTIDETGTTTYRPPFVPVPMTVIGGRRRGELMNPLKRLPLEAEHRADGAQMREYGGWLRPAWYGADDPDLTIQREAKRARDAVALFDGSSLGKIEVIGPDAARLVDFHSYNRLSTLKPGRDPLRLHPVGDRDRVRRRRDPAPRRRPVPRLVLVGAYRRGRHAARALAAGPVRSASCRDPRHDRSVGDADADRSPRPRLREGARPRGRARRREPAAHGVRVRRVRGRAAQDRAGELHRRPLLRALGPGFPGERAAGPDRRRAAGPWRRPPRLGGVDDPEGGEGLRHRRQGHRWDDHAARPRRRRAARSAQGRIHRQALAVHGRG